MNFLAHIYLAGNDEGLIIGNFIADFVKGNKKDLYPDPIRKGIELHRQIDTFTDTHPVTARSKSRLYPTQRKYAPVVLDLFYDHFLASDFSIHSSIPLEIFAESFYSLTERYAEFLPERVLAFLPYMKKQNWLNSYATMEGLHRSLAGLSSRVHFENNMNAALSDLETGYELFRNEFNLFFQELIIFTDRWKANENAPDSQVPPLF